jgi:virginiamycin B lyase
MLSSEAHHCEQMTGHSERADPDGHRTVGAFELCPSGRLHTQNSSGASRNRSEFWIGDCHGAPRVRVFRIPKLIRLGNNVRLTFSVKGSYDYVNCFRGLTMKLRLILVLLTAYQTVLGQTSGTKWEFAKVGVKAVQVPFASLKPAATFRIGTTADWVLVTADAVWVASSKPNSVEHIDPATNKMVAKVSLPGEACSGLAFGFGSLWVPLCDKESSLVRLDMHTNDISATIPVGPAGPEGGIAVSNDSIWIVTDKEGTLTRIDPGTDTVRQMVSISPGSYNPIFSDGVIWITGFESSTLIAVDAATGKVLRQIPVGPRPRFLTSGGGSVWTLNQGDGTVSRVDESSKRLVATISVGIPGPGGDICFGADSVWATVFDVPLSRIDSQTNKVLRQWVGLGGDSVRIGHAAVWVTDYRNGLLWRFPLRDATVQ